VSGVGVDLFSMGGGGVAYRIDEADGK
jgi:hypothetical protein